MSDNNRQLGTKAVNFSITDAVHTAFTGTGWPATYIIKSLKFKERVYAKNVRTPGSDGATINDLGADPEDFLSVEGFDSGANKAAALVVANTSPGQMEFITCATSGYSELDSAYWRLVSFERGHEVDGISHFSAELKRSATILAVVS